VSSPACTKEPVAQLGSEWIVGGGEMGQLIRSMDWSRTPLGPIASWPQSLRTTVNLCLASDLPICIIWGPKLVQLYNDGYRVICGEKHPRSMGQSFPECWREAWPVIGAAHDSALSGNTAFLENQHIFLERHGYTEECFFTFSFSPIRDETGSLAGLFHPVIETTAKMLGERRTRTLRDLAGGVSNAKSVDESFTLSTETLSEHALDVPFLLIYRLDVVGGQTRLVGATGLAPGANGAPETVQLDAPVGAAWPLDEVFRTGKAVLIDDVAARFGDLSVGPFPEPITSVMLLPIMTPGSDRPMAVVVAGVSPRLKSNEMYLGFHDQVSGAIATAVANADAYEGERSRAEAFARIDHAKTEFFSNVSHEFAVGFFPDRGGPGAGRLRSRRSRRAHRPAREQFPIGLRTRRAEPRGRLSAAARTRACGPGYVGDDCPQSPVQRVQVHVRGRNFDPCAGRRRAGGVDCSRYRCRHSIG